MAAARRQALPSPVASSVAFHIARPARPGIHWMKPWYVPPTKAATAVMTKAAAQSRPESWRPAVASLRQPHRQDEGERPHRRSR